MMGLMIFFYSGHLILYSFTLHPGLLPLSLFLYTVYLFVLYSVCVRAILSIGRVRLQPSQKMTRQTKPGCIQQHKL